MARKLLALLACMSIMACTQQKPPVQTGYAGTVLQHGASSTRAGEYHIITSKGTYTIEEFGAYATKGQEVYYKDGIITVGGTKYKGREGLI